MSYRDKCHYIDFKDKSTLGWLWRLELLPADPPYYFNGVGNTFEEFSDSIILTDEIGELEAAYSDQPLGISSIPTLKLQFATDNMTADEFSTIVVNTPISIPVQSDSEESTDRDYEIAVTNAWILRCDYGSGSISGSSDIFFAGVQRANGGFEETINAVGQSVCEITIVAALPELARLYSAERFGLYMLNNAEESDTNLRRQGFIYQTAFPSGSDVATVTDNFSSHRAMFLHTVNINNRLLERMRYVCGLFRIDGTVVKSIRFYHEHLKFYHQKTSDNLGVKDTAVEYRSDASNFQGGTPPDTQELWLACATVENDTSSNFSALGHGLFIKSGSSGSLMEGETVADMLDNFAKGNGSKCAYTIRNSRMVLSCGSPLDDFTTDYSAPTLTVSAATQLIMGEVKISTGVVGGAVRSATYNVDTAGSDDESEFKFQIGGNLSEVDYSAKCIIHNNLRIRKYENNWLSNLGNGDQTNKSGNKKGISWRQAGYDLRKFYCLRTISGLSSGLADHKILMVAHPNVEYYNGGAWNSSAPPTYLMDRDHWQGTFLQMQRTIGLPNILAKFVAQMLSNPRRALVECTVSLDVLDVNCIGRTVNVTFDGALSKYNYLHNAGDGYARAVVLSVKSSIQNCTSEVKLLVLPKD